MATPVIEVMVVHTHRFIAVSFGSLWEKKPVVVVFLRRLGCPICRQYVREVETIRPAIEAVGGSVVCISFEKFGEGSDVDRYVSLQHCTQN
jgi:peroxiredoxin